MTQFSIYAANLRDWFRRILNRRGSQMELHAFAERDLEVIARDIGMSKSDLSRVPCNDRAGELMSARLEQLYLDPDYVKNAYAGTYRDLQSVCASCKLSRRCANDLADGNVEAGMTGYCPNAPTMDALLVDSRRR